MIEVEKANTGEVLVIGHRGAMGYAPENTMASFEMAVELDADLVELDVHLSRDDELVVIHDPNLGRTTDGHGRVKDLSLAELKRLDAGAAFDSRFSGERIPALREVLEWACEKMPLVIEIKGDPEPASGIEEKLIDLIGEYHMLDKVMLISFHHPSVKRVKEIEPGLATGILYAGYLVDTVAAANAALADSLRPAWSYWTEELVREAHAAGLAASTWTVNEPNIATALQRIGIDSIGTNYPDTIGECLKAGA